MNFICEEIIDHAKGVLIAKQPQDLVNIRDDKVAATVWQRQLQPDFQSWLNDIPPENLPAGRLTLPKERVAQAVFELCDIAATPNDPERELLINDIDALCQLFTAIMGVKYVRLRLERVDDNACRKFHKDAISARLICTYRGEGTQYGTSIDGDDPSQIFTAPTGAPLLLRGSKWPEKPDSGLLHRSPPIQGKGETRLLLVIDPVFDLEKDAASAH